MRITRRTSGGRGEYEISERAPGRISPSDLVEKDIVLNLGRGVRFDTGTTLRHVQGKFRIRLKPGTEMHLHRQVVASLMLPESVRASSALGSGFPVIQRGRYTIQHIHVDKVVVRGEKATLYISTLEARNASQEGEEIDVAGRVKNLRLVWKERLKLPAIVCELVEDHNSAVMCGGPIPQGAENVVRCIEQEMSQQETDLGIPYSGLTDVLPVLVKALDVELEEPVTRLEEIEPEALELRRRVMKDWRRWAARRGGASAKFRRDVREAYNSTCIVCGEKYPSTPFNRVPGVDAAHILPWAEYDLDEVFNGICLCKLHHWAFDEGIIVIRYENGAYFVEIPARAKETIQPERTGFSLGKIERYAGRVLEDRLPRNLGARPRPALLDALQRLLE